MGKVTVVGGKVGMEAPVGGISLADIAEGSIVKLNENGSPVEFYVAKHNYEPTLNGTGRTLLVRKSLCGSVQWRTDNVNVYENSTLDSYLANTYKAVFDPALQSLIGTTLFYFANGSNQIKTLSRSVFALSVTELGITDDFVNVEGSALPIADVLSAKTTYNGNPAAQWTRSRYTYTAVVAACSVYSGNVSSQAITNDAHPRPAFTLPSTVLFDAKTLVLKGVS